MQVDYKLDSNGNDSMYPLANRRAKATNMKILYFILLLFYGTSTGFINWNIKKQFYYTPFAAVNCLCNCGIPNRSKGIDPPRVIGGEETEVNEYPWQVGLEFDVDGGRIR